MTGFFTTIVELSHERVITSDDFKPFIGESNWLAFGKGEELGKDCDDFCSGVVWEFRLVAVTPDDKLIVALTDGPHMVMDADELAIRMDES